MSLCLTERNVEGLSSPQLALISYRLRERMEVASTESRRQMLDRMSRAYMAFGLARTHAEHGSDKVGMLCDAAAEHLEVARSIRW